MLQDILLEIEKGYVVHQSTHDKYRSIRIMSKDGNAFARLDQYFQQNDMVCLNSLYVCDASRNKGIGTYLQYIRERIGVELGAKEAFLSVKVNTWMHDWYLRRGYEYYMDDTDSHVFMKKYLHK